ncbi:armadillo repeat-containing protein 8-like [Oscarella lobularis]|uniref:armadillo repeat-containing protein 8-like n=1 Tax=Oscarella lobularis TaxID=121494 RepID=UPI00331390DD
MLDDETMDVAESDDPGDKDLLCLAATDVDRETLYESVTSIKNKAIGSNPKKTMYIERDIITRLEQVLLRPDIENRLVVETVIALGTFAFGNESHVNALLERGHVIIPLLLKGLCDVEMSVVGACLHSLNAIYQNERKGLPVHWIYENPDVLPTLLDIVKRKDGDDRHFRRRRETFRMVEHAVNVLTFTCRSPDHQVTLVAYGIIDVIAPLLASSHERFQLASLKCLASIATFNQETSSAIAQSFYCCRSIHDIVANDLLSRGKDEMIQLWAAKCLSYLSRTGALQLSEKITINVIDTFARICMPGHSKGMKAEAATSLAYFIEDSPDLQQMASTCQGLIKVIAKFFADGDVKLKRSGFLLLSSLATRHEHIRRKISDIAGLSEHLCASLEESRFQSQLPALKCLLTLSRSVKQLRSGLKSPDIARKVLALLSNKDDDESVLSLASAVMCNFLLEFSPSKQEMHREGIINVLVKLATCNDHVDAAVKINAIWGLMNMSYESSEQVRLDIISALGVDGLLGLLQNSNKIVLAKSLGLTRNLLTDPTEEMLSQELKGREEDLMKVLMLCLKRTKMMMGLQQQTSPS